MKLIFSESLSFWLSFDDFFIIFGWFFTILWPYEKKCDFDCGTVFTCTYIHATQMRLWVWPVYMYDVLRITIAFEIVQSNWYVVWCWRLFLWVDMILKSLQAHLLDIRLEKTKIFVSLNVKCHIHWNHLFWKSVKRCGSLLPQRGSQNLQIITRSSLGSCNPIGALHDAPFYFWG